MEKSINRGELTNFKASDAKQNAMVPGIFNESPLKYEGSPTNSSGRENTVKGATANHSPRQAQESKEDLIP